jgi:hypothetical protein
LKFLTENLSIILFFIFLIGGYLIARLHKKQVINVDGLLILVWQSVALSLTLTYGIGTLDYFFSTMSHFGFTKNDVVVIAVPGAICIAILAASVYYSHIRKPSGRGKK